MSGPHFSQSLCFHSEPRASLRVTPQDNSLNVAFFDSTSSSLQILRRDVLQSSKFQNPPTEQKVGVIWGVQIIFDGQC